MKVIDFENFCEWMSYFYSNETSSSIFFMYNNLFLMLYLEYNTLKFNFTMKKTPKLTWNEEYLMWVCNTSVSLDISLYIARLMINVNCSFVNHLCSILSVLNNCSAVNYLFVCPIWGIWFLCLCRGLHVLCSRFECVEIYLIFEVMCFV